MVYHCWLVCQSVYYKVLSYSSTSWSSGNVVFVKFRALSVCLWSVYRNSTDGYFQTYVHWIDRWWYSVGFISSSSVYITIDWDNQYLYYCGTFILIRATYYFKPVLIGPAVDYSIGFISSSTFYIFIVGKSKHVYYLERSILHLLRRTLSWSWTNKRWTLAYLLRNYFISTSDIWMSFYNHTVDYWGKLHHLDLSLHHRIGVLHVKFQLFILNCLLLLTLIRCIQKGNLDVCRDCRIHSEWVILSSKCIICKIFHVVCSDWPQ